MSVWAWERRNNYQSLAYWLSWIRSDIKSDLVHFLLAILCVIRPIDSCLSQKYRLVFLFFFFIQEIFISDWLLLAPIVTTSPLRTCPLSTCRWPRQATLFYTKTLLKVPSVRYQVLLVYAFVKPGPHWGEYIPG